MFIRISAIVFVFVFLCSPTLVLAAKNVGPLDSFFGFEDFAVETTAVISDDDVCAKLNKKSIYEDHKITADCSETLICYCGHTNEWSTSKYKNCSSESSDERTATVYCYCNEDGKSYNCRSAVSGQ
jgi:hypothetical protein